MFNRSAFNRSPFNRTFTAEVLFSATLEGDGGMTAAANVEYLATITMQGEGELTASFIREIVSTAIMQGEGEISAPAIRERLFSAFLEGEGTLSANAGRFHVQEIEVITPFAPGEKVIIDSTKFRVTKNGQSLGYNGDFFDLHSGENLISYTDSATGRSIQIRVTHRDKYLY